MRVSKVTITKYILSFNYEVHKTAENLLCDVKIIVTLFYYLKMEGLSELMELCTIEKLTSFKRLFMSWLRVLLLKLIRIFRLIE